MLAGSVQDFRSSGNVHYAHPDPDRPKRIRLTNEGVEMEATLSVASPTEIQSSTSPVLRDFMQDLDGEPLYFLKLTCRRVHDIPQSDGVNFTDVELILTMYDMPGGKEGCVEKRFMRCLRKQVLERKSITIL